MILLISSPYDVRWATIQLDPSTGENMVFVTKEEAKSYAERTIIHEWFIVELSKTKRRSNYYA